MSEQIGQAVVLLAASAEKNAAASPTTSYGMKGKLYKSRSGWILLSVPNGLVRGAFDALNEPGLELPPSGPDENGFNAHISVMRPEELETVEGGADAITERGKDFSYTLGPIKTVTPSGWGEMSKVWFIEVQSPELKKLRRSYGLTSLPKNNQFQFHITIAVRRKHAFSKAASLIYAAGETNVADRGWDGLLRRGSARYGGGSQTAPSLGWLLGDVQGAAGCDDGGNPTGLQKSADAAADQDDDARAGAAIAKRVANRGRVDWDERLRRLQERRGESEKRGDSEHVPTVAVDLDGTIFKYDGWKGEDHFGELRSGAKKALKYFQKMGWRIIIHTTRGASQKVKDKLHELDVPYDYVNENPDQPEGSSDKPIADVYIDDRAVDARKSWAEITRETERRMKAAGVKFTSPLDDLKGAKQESDRGNYGAKYAAVRRLMQASPGDFAVDSRTGHVVGITHTPTGFRFHVPHNVVPTAYKQADSSIYLNAAKTHGKKMLHGQTPIYDPNQGLMDNVMGHLSAIRERGNQAIREATTWDSMQNAMDPNRASRQLLSYISGQRKPIVNNPLDRVISGDFRL